MKTPASAIVKIAEPKGSSGLSKAQASFNRLIKKIDQSRKRLTAWQEVIPVCQQKYAAELEPLQRELDEHRLELVHLLDNAYSHKIFRKNDRAKISDIICSVATELLQENDDEELKTIYNRHSQSDFDTEAEVGMEAAKSMMEDMFGIDFGDEDIDFRSPEKVMLHLSEKMQQKFTQEEQFQKEAEEQSAKRPKSKKTLAREARLEKEAQNVSQSIREVYRKLISSLHPDREQDLQERDRKTVLMQRVNVAYDNKDLLALLELQLEIEQIDQTMINTITEDRLKYYNKVLAEQATELQQEITGIEVSFRIRFNMPPEAKLSSATAVRVLQNDIDYLRQNIEAARNDLILFQDAKNIKNWLKAYRIAPLSLFDDGPFGDMGMDAFFRF